MAAAKEKVGRRPRGRAVPSDLPKMVSHLLVAERLGVHPDTLRKWSQSDPPEFPKADLIIGQMWFYNEDRIKSLFEGKGWTEKIG